MKYLIVVGLLVQTVLWVGVCGEASVETELSENSDKLAEGMAAPWASLLDDEDELLDEGKRSRGYFVGKRRTFFVGRSANEDGDALAGEQDDDDDMDDEKRSRSFFVGRRGQENDGDVDDVSDLWKRTRGYFVGKRKQTESAKSLVSRPQSFFVGKRVPKKEYEKRPRPGFFVGK